MQTRHDKRALFSLFLFSAVALAILVSVRPARADVTDLTVDCSAKAQEGYAKLAKQKPSMLMMTFGAIAMSQQKLYFCRVQQFFHDSVKAEYLARIGLRTGQLALSVSPTNTHVCADISQILGGAISDTEKLQAVDAAPELEAYKNDVRAVRAEQCTTLLRQMMEGSDPSGMTKDFCAYKKKVEAELPGSTEGFSNLVVKCD